MKGYQVTFFTEQNRRHGFTPLGPWLLEFAKEHGALGGTLVGGAEGFDHLGHIHSVHLIDLADQPIAVTFSIDKESAHRLFEDLATEPVDVTYVKVPVECGRIGAKAAPSAASAA
ncbi:MAG TPA: DUF190 domain-containing protein [Hyphomicrobiaceae bacterium]|nr:DUF190 domain-containing protein [Hyphomicrobiaceae bacterium]